MLDNGMVLSAGGMNEAGKKHFIKSTAFTFYFWYFTLVIVGHRPDQIKGQDRLRVSL